MSSSQENWGIAIAMQAGVTVYVVGSPGVAKTAAFRALAKKAGVYFVPLILRTRTPEDIGGFPKLGDIEIGGITYQGTRFYFTEEMLRSLHQKSLLLFDEFNQAGHDTLGAAQEWINNPPPNCWMAAAGNPVEESTAGQELSPPVINRLCQIQWETPWDAIEAGWEQGFCNYPEPDWPLLPKDWRNAAPAFGSLLKDFRARFPHLFPDGPPKDPMKACQPWVSPRSVTNAGLCLTAAYSVGATNDVQYKLIAGCCGEGFAKEFLPWLETQDVPDPRVILADPSSLKLPARFDLKQVIISGVLGCVETDGTPETWEAAYDVLEVAYGQCPETAQAAEAKLMSIKPGDFTPRERNGAALKMRATRLELGMLKLEKRI